MFENRKIQQARFNDEGDISNGLEDRGEDGRFHHPHVVPDHQARGRELFQVVDPGDFELDPNRFQALENFQTAFAPSSPIILPPLGFLARSHDIGQESAVEGDRRKGPPPAGYPVRCRAVDTVGIG